MAYEPQRFSHLFRIEDQHFWFSARNKAIKALIDSLALDFQSTDIVMEVGCGTGNVLRILEHATAPARVIGLDLFYEAMPFAWHRSMSKDLVQADINSPPFSCSQFRLIGMFDVLEHVFDDIGVLTSLHHLLHNDGHLLLTVPAHKVLWSDFDIRAHHVRRYEVEDLQSKLVRAGFHPVFLSEYMFSIYPLVWVGRRIADLIEAANPIESKKRDHIERLEFRIVPGVNAILRRLLSLEAQWLGQLRKLPVGTSLIALARKV